MQIETVAAPTTRSGEEIVDALEGGGMALHYQPIVDLATEAVTGFEALIRLYHPAVGIVPAAQFIPIAERCGLMRQLDDWVLWTACEQLTRWQEDVLVAPDFSMAINICGSELDGAGLAERMRQAFDATGVNPSGVVIELTETQQIDPAAARYSVDALHALGARVALDDFGSSFATFGRLRCLDFDVVKIDRSLTALADTNPGAGLIRTVLAAGRDLDATVVAEGIETRAQARCVEVLGCHLGQGYLWAPALPLQEAEARLSLESRPV